MSHLIRKYGENHHDLGVVHVLLCSDEGNTARPPGRNFESLHDSNAFRLLDAPGQFVRYEIKRAAVVANGCSIRTYRNLSRII
jgi:hypothetical protein